MSKIIRLKEVGSTNQYLREILKKEPLAEGSLVVVENQLSGKGQANNTWESEKGKNLTCSMVLYPDFIDIKNQFVISEMISLAIADMLSAFVENVRIKWPNDIYVGNKKITGILIENSISENVIESSIIGMGININQEIFTSNAPNPVSLKQITKEDYDLDMLLKKLIQHILDRYNQLIEGKNKKIHQEYFNNLFRNNGYHLYKSQDVTFKAKIKAIKTSGHLVLETEEGLERMFAFKEVEFVKL